MVQSSSSSIHALSSDQRYRLLASHAVEHAMIVTDVAGIMLEWSPGAEKLLGWSAGEIIGKPFAMIFTDEDCDSGAPKDELNTAMELGRSSDVRWHRRKDGSEVFCDGVVNKLLDPDDGNLIGFGKILREAYSMKKDQLDERNPVASEQRSFLAAVLESVESGIVVCDRQGKLTFFNEAAQQIHGMKATPLASGQWAEHYNLYRADGKTLLPVEEIPLHRALMGERVDEARILVRTPDGQQRDIEVTGRPLKDGAGHILGAVVSMHDITVQQEAKDARDETMREQGKRIEAEASHQRLRTAKEQLRMATEAARLGIWTWDVEHDRGTWENEQMYRIFDVAPGQPIVNGAQLLDDYLHPDDAAGFTHATEQTIRLGKRFYFNGRIFIGPDGAVRWVELTGELTKGKDGSGKVIVGTAADITQRKEIEKTLDEARLRLAATLSAGEVATWIWDIHGDQIVGDRNLAHLFDVSEEVASGAPLEVFTDSIHPADREEVTLQIRRSVATGEPYLATYRIMNRQGGYRWVNARGRIECDDNGQPVYLAGVILDITVQEEAQDALRLAEERYRTLITSMDEAFAIVQVLVDDEGKPRDYRFEQVNRALEEQSGLVDAAGRTIREMVPNIESHWIEIYGRVALTREPARFTEHSEAMGYWWDVYAAPIGHPDERRIAILFTDITARKQAEETLRQTAADLSETNRRKTEFLATLAHELRNPLAPMRTGLDLMRMTSRDNASSHRVLEMMDRQLRQMVHLIDDLMDVSRINSGKIILKKERVDLQDAISHAVEMALPAIEAAHHQMQVELREQGMTVQADPTRLAQILSNLLTNAVKYTPSGGHIALSAWQVDGAVVIAVKDSGIGIPPEEQARVFDMFSQVSRNMGRAQGGLGIGLSLVRSLVDMHGGSIKVESAGAGQGSTFTVRLPIPDESGAAGFDEQAPDAPGGAANAGLRLVVADDNVDAAIMLSALLEASGHATETVHDGVQALRTILASRPDVAILDIGMPGLSGYEVARQVRAVLGRDDIVLIALTGWGGELDRSRSDEAGFDAHLTKPAGLDELNRLMANIVEVKSRAG